MPNPSAPAENALHRPSGESARCRLNSTKTAILPMAVAPPANARSDSPVRNDWHARCSATSDEEHAVSTVIAGPSSPNA
jgi:hypothetical protein